ncbi:MAG: Obg family GTPase CgtA, partial [Clostridiales bacterium]|nr:Obg family GTPase CgtA [Clostridiales bacterium]
VFPVSAATGLGFDDLLNRVIQMLDTLPLQERYEESPAEVEQHITGYTVRKEEDTYIVEGHSIASLIASVNFEDHESMIWFHATLQKSGIITALREAGATEGDGVRMNDMEFDFID